MRILIYGLNFSPELAGIGKYSGEMAQWLARRGVEGRCLLFTVGRLRRAVPGAGGG